MKINVERDDIKEWLTSTKGEKDHKELWEKINKMVSVTKRKRVTVNLYKLNRYTKEGDNIIVPGKVLSFGKIDHKVNITAIDFSDKAKEQLQKAGSKIYDLNEFKKFKNIIIIR